MSVMDNYKMQKLKKIIPSRKEKKKWKDDFYPAEDSLGADAFGFKKKKR